MAILDPNSVAILYGVSDLDGVTPIKIEIEPISGGIYAEVHTGGSGSKVPPGRALKDPNSVSTLLCARDDSGVMAPAIDNTNGYLYADLG